METQPEFEKRGYGLVMAVAPTKNIERFEWFLEKATEIGCDRFIPMDCRHSERHAIKHEREMKVITSAVKQSLKAYHPALYDMTPFRDVVTMPFDGVRLIAHCRETKQGKLHINKILGKGENALILIGPEGDFSQEEVNFAHLNGFREITLGTARLRTETAAVVAVTAVSIVND